MERGSGVWRASSLCMLQTVPRDIHYHIAGQSTLLSQQQKYRKREATLRGHVTVESRSQIRWRKLLPPLNPKAIGRSHVVNCQMDPPS